MPFGKETQEVVCIGQLIFYAYLACNPLALSCIEIGYFLLQSVVNTNELSMKSVLFLIEGYSVLRFLVSLLLFNHFA